MSRDDNFASFRHKWAVGYPSVNRKTEDSVISLDDKRPQPDTVTAMGRLIVDIAGSDVDQQRQVAEQLALVVSSFIESIDEFVKNYITPNNKDDFMNVLRCIVNEESHKQDN